MTCDSWCQAAGLTCVVLCLSGCSPSGASLPSSQSGAVPGDNMACVERLRYPPYPPIALAARLEFSTLALVTLTNARSTAAAPWPAGSW